MREKTKINKNREYKKIYNRGKSMASSVVVTYCLKNKFSGVRFGITTSKKIGNAVKRNRARRIIRAAFAELRNRIKDGFDFIFVARSKTCFVKTQDVLKDMEFHLEKLGALK